MASKRTRPPRNELSPAERELFLDAVSGAVALADRQLAPPAPRPRAVKLAPPTPPPAQLLVELAGERYRARAAGVSKAQVAELAAGKRHIHGRLDLHGRSAAEAAEVVRNYLGGRLSGECVLIIHGKGLHSEGLSVLRDATVQELLGPSSGMVQAFATAQPRDGGEGATYVLVKR
ncbi:MAG: Smr/MutS family protein [Kofleriaceae bacterium]